MDETVKDIYQIEKNGTVLLDYKTYNRNYTFLGILLVLAGLFIAAYGIWKFKK